MASVYVQCICFLWCLVTSRVSGFDLTTAFAWQCQMQCLTNCLLPSVFLGCRCTQRFVSVDFELLMGRDEGGLVAVQLR